MIQKNSLCEKRSVHCCQLQCGVLHLCHCYWDCHFKQHSHSHSLIPTFFLIFHSVFILTVDGISSSPSTSPDAWSQHSSATMSIFIASHPDTRTSTLSASRGISFSLDNEGTLYLPLALFI